MTLNRRHWLRNATMASAGLAFGAKAGISSNSISVTNKVSNFMEWELTTPAKVDLYALKARLLANENPHGPSDKARLAIMDSVAIGNRYGHGKAAELIDKIAVKEGVPKEYIMLGPGSSDLLEKTAVSLYKKGGNIVSADPAYMSLIKTALSMKADWKSVPLNSEWAHDLPAMESAIDADTKLVYICNPNNPTGTITPSKDLYSFCDSVAEKKLIFMDEAYLEFMNDGPDKLSMVDLISKGKNIIVSRTFSKVHGMAGLRIGYIVALPETLALIKENYRGNMGMNITALNGAMASMDDADFIKMSAKLNKESRDYVMGELKSMGYSYLPSQTSFILFPIDMPGDEFLPKMFDLGIGVRSFEVFGQSYCRVSMGTMPEMKLFIDAIKDVLA